MTATTTTTATKRRHNQPPAAAAAAVSSSIFKTMPATAGAPPLAGGSTRRIPHRRVTIVRRGGAALLASILLLYLIQAAAGFFINEGPHWSYSDQNQWAVNHKACNKNAQSPIDIQRKHVIFNDNLKLQLYNYRRPTKFLLENAHHTIKLSVLDASRMEPRLEALPSEMLLMNEEERNVTDMTVSPEDATDSDVEIFTRKPGFGRGDGAREDMDSSHSNLEPSRVPLHPNSIDEDNQFKKQEKQHNQPDNSELLAYGGAPSIKLDWLDDGNNEYKLQDIHFHWAERKDNGSEHAIDGKRAAMEMHLVHIKHGLDKSQVGITSDSLTVIAVLIESTRKGNSDMNPIVNALTRINASSQAQSIEYKSLYDILPSESISSFYTYSGSLTTPPCHQVVNWIVLSDRLSMNAKQIELFRNLYSPHVSKSGLVIKGVATTQDYHADDHQLNSHLIMPNIRQLQPLNDRTIMASFPLSGRYGLAEAYSGAVSTSSAHLTGLWLFLILFCPLVTLLPPTGPIKIGHQS